LHAAAKASQMTKDAVPIAGDANGDELIQLSSDLGISDKVLFTSS
jgi:hypothetical protein